MAAIFKGIFSIKNEFSQIVELLHLIGDVLKQKIRKLEKNSSSKFCLKGEKVKKHENEAENDYVTLEGRWRHR